MGNMHKLKPILIENNMMIYIYYILYIPLLLYHITFST